MSAAKHLIRPIATLIAIAIVVFGTLSFFTTEEFHRHEAAVASITQAMLETAENRPVSPDDPAWYERTPTDSDPTDPYVYDLLLAYATDRLAIHSAELTTGSPNTSPAEPARASAAALVADRAPRIAPFDRWTDERALDAVKARATLERIVRRFVDAAEIDDIDRMLRARAGLIVIRGDLRAVLANEPPESPLDLVPNRDLRRISESVNGKVRLLRERHALDADPATASKLRYWTKWAEDLDAAIRRTERAEFRASTRILDRFVRSHRWETQYGAFAEKVNAEYKRQVAEIEAAIPEYSTALLLSKRPRGPPANSLEGAILFAVDGHDLHFGEYLLADARLRLFSTLPDTQTILRDSKLNPNADYRTIALALADEETWSDAATRIREIARANREADLRADTRRLRHGDAWSRALAEAEAMRGPHSTKEDAAGDPWRLKVGRVSPSSMKLARPLRETLAEIGGDFRTVPPAVRRGLETAYRERAANRLKSLRADADKLDFNTYVLSDAASREEGLAYRRALAKRLEVARGVVDEWESLLKLERAGLPVIDDATERKFDDVFAKVFPDEGRIRHAIPTPGTAQSWLAGRVLRVLSNAPLEYQVVYVRDGYKSKLKSLEKETKEHKDFLKPDFPVKSQPDVFDTQQERTIGYLQFIKSKFDKHVARAIRISDRIDPLRLATGDIEAERDLGRLILESDVIVYYENLLSKAVSMPNTQSDDVGDEEAIRIRFEANEGSLLGEILATRRNLFHKTAPNWEVSSGIGLRFFAAESAPDIFRSLRLTLPSSLSDMRPLSMADFVEDVDRLELMLAEIRLQKSSEKYKLRAKRFLNEDLDAIEFEKCGDPRSLERMIYMREYRARLMRIYRVKF